MFLHTRLLCIQTWEKPTKLLWWSGQESGGQGHKISSAELIWLCSQPHSPKGQTEQVLSNKKLHPCEARGSWSICDFRSLENSSRYTCHSLCTRHLKQMHPDKETSFLLQCLLGWPDRDDLVWPTSADFSENIFLFLKAPANLELVPEISTHRKQYYRVV